MGQDWIVVDLDAKLIIGGGTRLGEWFWDGNADVMNALRTPARNALLDELVRGHMADQGASALFSLAQELHDLVLNELENDDYMALLSFAVTCKAALVRSRRHILAHQRRCASLAGHRIVCVDEDAETPECLPRGMLTDEEVQQLQDFGEKYDCGPSLPWYAESGHFREASYHDLRNPDKATSLQFAMLDSWTSARRWHTKDWGMVKAVVTPYYPEDHPWALCSLTKREYVRKDAAMQLCAGLPATAHEDGDRLPEFWHFLLASICWSTHAANSMPYKGEDLTKGRWAGDRIAVDLLESLSPATGGAWTDVTDEVGALVKRMWMAQYTAETQPAAGA